ncbi:MAG: NUDIX domain-containing protein [Nostocaceae cyanobacterium]|nr:NUDIX domain-containing protein [Nostocaceae cyanobacterium]
MVQNLNVSVGVRILMAKLIYGDRIAKLGKVTLGCSAVIFDGSRQKILLTRRTDNGRWCLPGGRMDAGESAAEGCIREVLEETGLQGNIKRLLGVYSNPNYMIEYADGERCHVVALNFEVEITGGNLGISNETTEYGYFSLDEIKNMDLMEHNWDRVQDAFSQQESAFVR